MNQNTSANVIQAMSPDQYHTFADMEYEKLRKAIVGLQKEQRDDLINQHNEILNSIEIIGNFDLSSVQITEK